MYNTAKPLYHKWPGCGLALEADRGATSGRLPCISGCPLSCHTAPQRPCPARGTPTTHRGRVPLHRMRCAGCRPAGGSLAQEMFQVAKAEAKDAPVRGAMAQAFHQAARAHSKEEKRQEQ